MPTFRKRPVCVEAVQFHPSARPWPEGVYESELSPTGFAIGTLENTAIGHEVSPFDWIITGIAGEKYPVKPAIFEATYEFA